MEALGTRRERIREPWEGMVVHARGRGERGSFRIWYDCGALAVPGGTMADCCTFAIAAADRRPYGQRALRPVPP
eukprot:9469333-Pyramimonas_sp.AAC.1